MPLRDHFRPPVLNIASWEGFHGLLPGVFVLQLSKILPEDFSVEPRVHLGNQFEIDVNAFESDNDFASAEQNGSWGTATATAVAPRPTMIRDVEIAEEYAYEVLIYDRSRGRQLVAALEIVSPANKERPGSRQAFVAKCAALMQNRICVSIVDLVTTRNFNLYGELLASIGESGPAFTATSPATYAVTFRGHKVNERTRLEEWAYPLVLGQPLPSLPIWLTDDLHVILDLESAYEETCQALRIR